VKSPFSIETNIHILKLYNKNNGIETDLNHAVNCLYSQKKIKHARNYISSLER
jgi:hypothetical protein